MVKLLVRDRYRLVFGDCKANDFLAFMVSSAENTQESREAGDLCFAMDWFLGSVLTR